jgi:translocation and assembly module TamB
VREVRQAGQAGTVWTLRGSAALQDLDPAPWWPGLGEAWQRGPHRLSGRLDADLSLPANADWRRIGGRAELVVDDSVLAGVPLQGRAELQPDGALTLALQAGGNRVDASLLPDRTAPSRGAVAGEDSGRITIDAPTLDRLVPWAALHPALAALPRAGRVQAQGQWQGRWPDLRGEGRADAQGLAGAGWRVDDARLRWQAGSAIDAPLQASLRLRAVQWQGQRLAYADLRLDGTPAAHRLTVDAALPLLPPQAVVRSLALRTDKGTRLGGRIDGRLLRLDGGTPDRPGNATTAATAPGWRWQGTLEALGAGSWDGNPASASNADAEASAPAPAPMDWIAVQPMQAEVEFDATGALRRLRADAGRMRVADTFTLTWDELRWSEGSVQWQARLEDFAVTPLLDRWQPDMGWEGSLRVGGRLALSLGERTQIDVVIERERGDLGVRESPEVSIPFGLTDLRLALQAQDGTWTFTQALAGRTLGELGGLVRVQSVPQARWPRAEDPLDGALIGRVANLGVWGAWVPPGWRLQGSVASQVVLGGRLGVPELRGTLAGDDLGVRNLLQGVHVRDGVVRLRLDGAQATVERFEFRGGDGRLALTGNATLGDDPRADLVLQAEGFHLLSRIDRRLVASGQARLTLAPQALTLRGRFGVDEGLFDASRSDAPTLDDDVVVQRADAPAVQTTTTAAPPPQRRVDVAVEIDLGDRLRVRGRGLDARLAGSLRVTAPGGRLAVQGTVNTVDGTYAAYAQKLEIRRGDLAFSGDPANPRLDVLALRPNLDIEVGVAITGNVQSPRVRLYSNPDLSETDKLSWLVLGRDPAGLGRADTALLQRAAVALLAGEGEAPTDTLMRNLGLDEFSVRQDDDGNGTGETVVSLGKQLSRRWYVGYERGVNATVGTWQLIYRVAQRFTLRAQSGAENALDAIWVWRVP